MEESKESINLSNGDPLSENVKLKKVEDVIAYIKYETDNEGTSEMWGHLKQSSEEDMVDCEDTFKYSYVTDKDPQSENIKLEEVDITSGSIKTEIINEEHVISSKQNNDEVSCNFLSEDCTKVRQTLNDSNESFPKENMIVDPVKTDATEQYFKCELCGRQYLSLRQLKDHSNYHKNAGRFSCDFCDKKFPSKQHLRQHLRKHAKERVVDCKDSLRNSNETENEAQSGSVQTVNKNEEFFTCSKQNRDDAVNNSMSKDSAAIKQLPSVDEKSIKCPLCNETFPKRFLMKLHLTTHSKENNFKCGLCDKSYPSLKQLKEHSKRHRYANRYSCEVCDKKFSNVGNLKTHLARHVNERSFKCHMCEKSYIRKLELTNHLKTHLGIKDFKCNECGKEFITLAYLQHHSTVHTKKLTYQCDVCDKSYYWLACLRQHQKKHKNPQFKCRFCDQSFINNSLLTKHENVHTGVEHKCKYCGKIFTTKYVVLKHELQHTAQNLPENLKYKCGLCDKRFYNQRLLKEHTLSHQEANDQFPCEYCQKPFSTKSRMQVHVRKHIGDSNICQVCRYKCESSTDLYEHLQSHTKEKPFNCQFCERSFLTVKCRKKHEKIHSGQNETHKCSYCGKEFPAKTNLLVHERIHTGECPYRCDICSKSFKQNYLLIRHMKKHHNSVDNT